MDNRIGPAAICQAITRRVILWCVEAYFGRLGGDYLAGAYDPPTRVPSAARPMHVSNR